MSAFHSYFSRCKSSFLCLAYLIGICWITNIYSSTEPTYCIECTPIDKNCLKGWKAFTIMLPSFIAECHNPNLYKNVACLFNEELGKIGKVAKMPLNDLTGMATSGNILHLVLDEIKPWQTKTPSLFCITLRLEATTMLLKTQTECRTYIWSKSLYIQKNQADNKNLMEVVSLLIKGFAQCYLEANPDHKPIFYIYE